MKAAARLLGALAAAHALPRALHTIEDAGRTHASRKLERTWPGFTQGEQASAAALVAAEPALSRSLVMDVTAADLERTNVLKTAGNLANSQVVGNALNANEYAEMATPENTGDYVNNILSYATLQTAVIRDWKPDQGYLVKWREGQLGDGARGNEKTWELKRHIEYYSLIVTALECKSPYNRFHECEGEERPLDLDYEPDYTSVEEESGRPFGEFTKERALHGRIREGPVECLRSRSCPRRYRGAGSLAFRIQWPGPTTDDRTWEPLRHVTQYKEVELAVKDYDSKMVCLKVGSKLIEAYRFFADSKAFLDKGRKLGPILQIVNGLTEIAVAVAVLVLTGGSPEAMGGVDKMFKAVDWVQEKLIGTEEAPKLEEVFSGRSQQARGVAARLTRDVMALKQVDTGAYAVGVGKAVAEHVFENAVEAVLPLIKGAEKVVGGIMNLTKGPEEWKKKKAALIIKTEALMTSIELGLGSFLPGGVRTLAFTYKNVDLSKLIYESKKWEGLTVRARYRGKMVYRIQWPNGKVSKSWYFGERIDEFAKVKEDLAVYDAKKKCVTDIANGKTCGLSRHIMCGTEQKPRECMIHMQSPNNKKLHVEWTSGTPGGSHGKSIQSISRSHIEIYDQVVAARKQHDEVQGLRKTATWEGSKCGGTQIKHTVKDKWHKIVSFGTAVRKPTFGAVVKKYFEYADQMRAHSRAWIEKHDTPAGPCKLLPNHAVERTFCNSAVYRSLKEEQAGYTTALSKMTSADWQITQKTYGLFPTIKAPRTEEAEQTTESLHQSKNIALQGENYLTN